VVEGLILNPTYHVEINFFCATYCGDTYNAQEKKSWD